MFFLWEIKAIMFFNEVTFIRKPLWLMWSVLVVGWLWKQYQPPILSTVFLWQRIECAQLSHLNPYHNLSCLEMETNSESCGFPCSAWQSCSRKAELQPEGVSQSEWFKLHMLHKSCLCVDSLTSLYPSSTRPERGTGRRWKRDKLGWVGEGKEEDGERQWW